MSIIIIIIIMLLYIIIIIIMLLYSYTRTVPYQVPGTFVVMYPIMRSWGQTFKLCGRVDARTFVYCTVWREKLEYSSKNFN